ncbi:FimV N-terminal domain protein [Halothiobacillus neapolitanus c2]|uniref:FimV N-terminal domain protein n=1 Tax=Halothiobacillus neapolitanus (strain ATCC 23641 / DSM 15147 / CIP 104769 / NCIMB 8539 / c2) TaxID=555778 RepID=D0L1G4_HALNC|nr:FimV N-terminal domain protein [Halothiobacillus neapolitanus c2]TDN65351.1 pilus assembly protein FimV [Halothiobacillus neapolitanus]
MRKLSWIIAGILCSAPVFVHAAELGDAKIASHLTERLDVKIPITGLNGVSLDQVKVRLAPEKYYQQAGLSLDGLAGNITFQITSEGKRNYVIVRSKRAISNPILSLLIQINAGDGSQVKEFDFLLDPPVHAERRAMAASQNSFTGNVAEPAKTSRPVQSTSSWTPVANVPDVKMGGTYHVKRGDTLYDIAKTAVADKSVPVRPMMQAIINANPNAFIDGNGNLMKAGSKLKVPERAAVATVAAATAATEKAAGVQAPEAASTEAKPKLQLLAVEPDKEKATAATPEAAAPAAGTVTGGEMTGVLPAIDTPAAPTADTMQQNNEAIASIDAKSEVMSKQISMLNDQLKQVQGLVSERNQNIEQLQQKIKESNEQTQLLKKQLEAQNNNFWLQWAPYLMGGVGLLIIILLLVAISRGRKREPVESTIYSTTGAVAGAGALATQPKVEMEPRVVAEVAPKAPTVPSASVVADSKSVIDEARLLISYNLHTQAHDLVEDAIAQQPNELSLYQELARMYSEANNTAELEKVLTRIDEKFGPEHRPNNEELAIYSPAPTMLEMESAEAGTEVSAPDQSDALDAIPDSAFSFDADLDLPSKESADTSLDFDEPNQDSPEVEAESDLEILSLEGAEEPAPTLDDIDLELGDNTHEVPETVEEALPDLEPEVETSVQDDTRLGLAEAFLGVGDQESYKMIAEEIESEGNPALIAALKKIEQKFS